MDDYEKLLWILRYKPRNEKEIVVYFTIIVPIIPSLYVDLSKLTDLQMLHLSNAIYDWDVNDLRDTLFPPPTTESNFVS